jgi:hypothetical protein
MKTRKFLALGLGVTAFTGLIVTHHISLTASPSLAQASCNDRACVGEYQQADFWVTVASDNGIDGRLSTEVHNSIRSGDIFPKGMRLHCIGWMYGEKVQALGLNIIDARWYLVEVPGIASRGHLGNTRYIPAAWVFGDAPGSTPLP